MAQKVQVMVTCDLHGDDSVGGVDTLKFGFDGYNYEIDLCNEHSEQVHNQLQELISHARRAQGGRGRRSTPSRTRAERPSPDGAESRAVSDREQLQAIREWARGQGYDVKSRGRIPQVIVEEYEAARG